MNNDIAVVVFAWGGSRPIYQPWHVENMRRMVAKHLTLPHRFVVVTDNVEAHRAEGVEVVPIWTCPHHQEMKANWINCYVRLGLFDKDIGGAIAPRILSIDLDAVVRGNIDDLFEGSDPFKVMSLKARTWLQGGLFRVDPGKVHPCPWDQMARHEETKIFERSGKWVGSDQAVMSELFHADVQAGRIPKWNEEDGIALNDTSSPWRIFFRTGHKKCWFTGMQEREEYLAQSDRDGVPEGVNQLFYSPTSPRPRKTIQRVESKRGPRRMG